MKHPSAMMSATPYAGVAAVSSSVVSSAPFLDDFRGRVSETVCPVRGVAELVVVLIGILEGELGQSLGLPVGKSDPPHSSLVGVEVLL